jgi:hypothetical protein
MKRLKLKVIHPAALQHLTKASSPKTNQDAHAAANTEIRHSVSPAEFIEHSLKSNIQTGIDLPADRIGLS